MLNKNSDLNVKILDRVFKVSCKEDEKEDLLKSVDFLNEKMKDIQKSGNVIGLERIAIMTALNLAHALLTSSVNGSPFNNGDYITKIQELNKKIDKALSTQDVLF